MSVIVAGVDFGTLSVRVSLFDSQKGRISQAVAQIDLHRHRSDPDVATQSHEDHLRALTLAMRTAVTEAAVDPASVKALAVDTTGSSVIPVDDNMQPLGEYYLWCDHRSHREAAEITRIAHERKLPAIDWCGGVYSSEWGFAKLLHWLRHNPDRRARFGSAFEHCDYIAAVLCGVQHPKDAIRSVCAMGHKWLYGESWGGLPEASFFEAVDPLLSGVRQKLSSSCATSDRIAGTLSAEWAEKLGLSAGIPIPVGAFDAHWDAIAAGVRLGDVVNVIGTSTCIIGLSDQTTLVPGVCGVVPGSVHPQMTGIEAGLSAVGDIFDAIARRAGTTVAALSAEIAAYKPAQTGLLRLTWDNGDRTVLVNPELGGITIGWHLTTTAADELFAAIEGTAFHTRIILDRMQENGVAIRRVINGGGIPKKNPLLNQTYANVLQKPILVPEEDVTSLGSAIFAFLAAGAFSSVEDAQNALCPQHKVFEPEASSAAAYNRLFDLYRDLYFGFGDRDSAPVSVGRVLPELRRIAAETREYAPSKT